MINLDPAERPTFDSLLHTSRGAVFPESFYSFLHNYVSSINELSNETLLSNPSAPSTTAQIPIPPSVSSNLRPNSSSTMSPNVGGAIEGKPDPLPNDSDHRLERIWADYESIEPYILPETNSDLEMDVKVEYMPSVNTNARPFQVNFRLLSH